MSIFERRFYTTIRTSTNYMSFVFPLIGFTIGVITAKVMNVDAFIKNKEVVEYI